jgi:RIO kinase 2
MDASGLIRVSTVDKAAKLVKQLEGKDWKVLQAMERHLRSKESFQPERMTKTTHLYAEEIEFRLSELSHAGLVTRTPSGYFLLTAGLDAIALNALANRELISALGKAIGVGKESDVYEAITEDGTSYAAKFYRIGRTSFRAIKRKRSYYPEESPNQWLLMSVEAAKTEYNALRKLIEHRVSVPQVVARERHVILMPRIDGARLIDVFKIDDPRGAVSKILSNVRNAYLYAGVINGDLSEYNIMFDGENVWLIDWPQAVDRSHPNVDTLLDRDVLNVLQFFKRRFDVNYSLEDASQYVRGWRETLPI